VKLFSLHLGDCLEILNSFNAEFVDACITDPPYELNFMGKSWDNMGISFQKETWEAILRVLKPGAYLLAFGGSRTYHRIACAIEDAGFEIRDCIMWLYGSGFPKSLNISKAIDKKFGVNTNEAQTWDGFGSQLKPAFEPIILARKPLEGTTVDNVLKYGTGALNIDGCRVTTKDNLNGGGYSNGESKGMWTPGKNGGGLQRLPGKYKQPEGRWPTNVILSHHADCKLVGAETVKGKTINRFTDGAKPFGNGAGHVYQQEFFADEQVSIYDCVDGCPIKEFPETKSGTLLLKHKHNFPKTGDIYGKFKTNNGTKDFLGSEGSASRFFYCAKASPRERTCNKQVNNNHATVKPIDLMRYLARLIGCQPGSVILDPFMGSGTTGIAAIKEKFRFIGIEQNSDYLAIARKRIQLSCNEV
jgi:site-specific DNA-methyltransferase (adenine-specific)